VRRLSGTVTSTILGGHRFRRTTLRGQARDDRVAVLAFGGVVLGDLSTPCDGSRTAGR